MDFLHRNGRLLNTEGQPVINDMGLAVLAPLVAESAPAIESSKPYECAGEAMRRGMPPTNITWQEKSLSSADHLSHRTLGLKSGP